MESDPTIEISSKELHSRVQSNNKLLLLDVRSEESFKIWNILDSKNFPIKRILGGEFPEEYKEYEIVTICSKGNDSRIAAIRLRQKGYKARSLHGGLKGWNNILDIKEIKVNSNTNIYQFRRIAKGCLSYFIFVKDEGAIIDPIMNLDPYLQFAEENNVTIRYIFDTHLHADHVSGARILADKTDANLFLPEKDPYKFEYSSININSSYSLNGTKILRAVHTPGHTKGSISFHIKDLVVLSGDILFVDGVGRPDLTNKAEEFANDLYGTLTNYYLNLPKTTFIAPAHHGKFKMVNFKTPILTTIDEFSEKFKEKSNKINFIRSALDQVITTPHPPSYQTIIKINSGIIDFIGVDIPELEIGPNHCAIG